MSLTDKQIFDLNNMNEAARKAQLGTLVNDGGSGGGVTYTLPAATTTNLGGVKKASAVADATDATVTKEEFNALLTALRNAGILAK